jgi:hypothetical protein
MYGRILFAGIELLVLALLIGGCARSRVIQANEPVILLFKHAKHPRYTELSQPICQFEAENPHVRILDALGRLDSCGFQHDRGTLEV